MNFPSICPQTWIEGSLIGASREVRIYYKNTSTTVDHIPLDIGTLDPGLYLMNVHTTEKDFKLNIALKYSIIEDILSIIIFKCTFKVRN